MAAFVSERTRANQLEKVLQNKEMSLQTVLKELESLRSIRQRNPSMSSTDQEEIRNIMSPDTDPESDLMLQNERLKYDLDKSIGERRVLSQQMENWKRKLSTASDSEEIGEVDDDSDPVFIRMKQEQAYRSVGALQLRVEELTLEVTKVSCTFESGLALCNRGVSVDRKTSCLA